MKKVVIILVTVIIIVFSVILIAGNNRNGNNTNNDKVKVIATLFPQYDFVKEIGKSKVEAILLLPSGVESHEYEPKPEDILNINRSDLFIFTGEEMEPWADKIADSITTTRILDASKGVKFIENKGHDEEDEEHGTEHEHELDPHIWLDPNNACIMVDNILKELCEIDNVNSDYYIQNAEEYKSKLLKLDSDFTDMITDSKRNKIAFGGTFAYAYFVDRYGLEYISAYSSCGSGSEPSVSEMKEVVDYVKSNNIPIIFYPELSEGKIASTLAEETNTKMLVFHSVHNVTKEELDNGASYISLMRGNLQNLKQALN